MPSDLEIDPGFDPNPTLPGVPDPSPIFRYVREVDPVYWCMEARNGPAAHPRHAAARARLRERRATATC